MTSNITLFLVTFNLDLTQFLVNAKDDLEAIYIAKEHNKMVGDIDDGYDFDYDNYVNDYSVDYVDFKLLTEIVQRRDIVFTTDKAVVYAD